MKKSLCTLLFLSLGFLLPAETPVVNEANGNVSLSNGEIGVSFSKQRNFVFGFTDLKSKAPIMFQSQIWYHGRSGNTTHFYQDQAEPAFPLQNYQIKRDGQETGVTANVRNQDFDIAREVSMFNDIPAVGLRYTLTAREGREYGLGSFPTLHFNKEAASVSWNLDADGTKFETAANPSPRALAKAHMIFFHYPKLNRTVLVLANLNAPRKLDYPLGLAGRYNDIKWAKTLSFEHLYLDPIPYLEKGQKRNAEFYFQMLDGGTLTPAQEDAARKLAKRFGVKAPDFDFTALNRLVKMPSESAGRVAPEVWTEISMKKVFPSTAIPSQAVPAVRLETARGEGESAQLVVRPEKDTEMRGLTVSDLTSGSAVIPSSAWRTYLLEYQDRPNALSLYTGCSRVPDKLSRLSEMLPVRLKAGENQPVWLTVRIPRGIPAGLYRGTVTLTLSDAVRKIPVEVKVWNFELPEKSPYRAFGLLWNSPQSHRKELLELLSEYRFAATTNSGGQKELRQYFDGQELRLPDNFSTAQDAVRKNHMNAVVVPYLFLGAWDWKPGKKVQFLSLDPETPEFEKKLSAFLSSAQRQLKEKGILEESFAYMWDEVTAPHYPLMKKTTEMIRRDAPGLKTMCVGAPDPEVIRWNDIICVGSVGTWWGPDAEKIIAEAKQSGKEFWIYLNGETFVPDYPALTTRLTPWRSRIRGISGYLQWSMDYSWKSSFASQGQVWLLYPTSGTPVASVRLEFFRDGIEDYMYLEMLSPEDRKRLAPEIESVAPRYGSTESADPAKLLALRRKMAAALEASSK